jgi:hypothetical protein
MPTFLNPYVLLACLGLAIGLFGSGVSVGYKWEAGVHARDQLAAAQSAADRAREEAKTESDAAVLAATKAEAARQAGRVKRLKLEQEIGKDEIARNCRVGAGTFSVLQQSIRAANGAPPEASGVDAAVSAIPGTPKPISGGFSALTDGWRGRLRLMPPGEAGAGRVDQSGQLK